jgi:hypothetical protein
MSKEAFVFLDSTFTVSQHLQLGAIKQFANENDLSIIFYGSELVGFEHKHHVLADFLKRRPCDQIIFFSLAQFKHCNSLDIDALCTVLSAGIEIHFASQRISSPTIADLKILGLLALSTNDFSWLTRDVISESARCQARGSPDKLSALLLPRV